MIGAISTPRVNRYEVVDRIVRGWAATPGLDAPLSPVLAIHATDATEGERRQAAHEICCVFGVRVVGDRFGVSGCAPVAPPTILDRLIEETRYALADLARVEVELARVKPEPEPAGVEAAPIPATEPTPAVPARPEPVARRQAPLTRRLTLGGHDRATPPRKYRY